MQLIALSPAFPHTSKRLYQLFKTAPASYKAQYIIRRILSQKKAGTTGIFTRALRYPLCNKDVISILYQRLGDVTQTASCELPKWLFRNLNPNSQSQSLTESDEPLSSLEYLYDIPGLRPDLNSHGGYALTRAVYAHHEPLVRFLLKHGVSPSHKDGLCFKIAIRQKNLALFKMLMETKEVAGQDMLKLATKCAAWDITKYLTREMGVIPDLQTLLAMGL